MKNLWKELDNFLLIPNNICHDDWKTLEKMHIYKDSDQVIRFLKGLNDQYVVVRSQIMLIEHLPNTRKV